MGYKWFDDYFYNLNVVTRLVESEANLYIPDIPKYAIKKINRQLV